MYRCLPPRRRLRAGKSAHRDREAPSGEINTMPMATNGITAKIQADLDNVKTKIDRAVKSLQEATAFNQGQRALSVSNVATQIRNLAANDLA